MAKSDTILGLRDNRQNFLRGWPFTVSAYVYTRRNGTTRIRYTRALYTPNIPYTKFPGSKVVYRIRVTPKPEAVRAIID